MLFAGSVAFILAAATPASAIVINDALDPTAPPVVDTGTFPNVLSFPVTTAGLPCTATLISPKVVLTAAHCLVDDQGHPIVPMVSGQIASSVFLASGFINDPKISQANDIAVFVLPNALTNVPRSALQLGGNPIAKETPIYIVGYGAWGTGTGTLNTSDLQRRKAQTNIGEYDLPADVAHSGQPFYSAQFRDPANPNRFNSFGLLTPPPSLQGGIAGGDSGGPIFYCPAGALDNCTTPQLVQIGVACCSGGSPFANGDGYGSIASWTPTALFSDWISSLGLPGMLVANAGNYNWSDPGAWTNGATPGNQDVAWLVNQGSITLNTNAQVDSLWISGGQSQFIIRPAFTLATTTNTNLANGMLSVNGVLNTPFLYMSGGVLNGAGMITGPGGITWVANVGGTVAPGTASALGTLTIQGDYFQGPSGQLQVRLAGTGNDRLEVTRQAILGGTLVAVLTSSPLTRQYTVLHADGGLGGTTFGRVATFNVPANFSAAPAYDANDVFLNFTAELGLSNALPKNASNVATSINNFFNSGGTLPPDFGNLFFLTGGNLSNALSQVSGEAATGAQQPAFQLTNQFLGLMLDPFVDGRSGVGGADHPALGFAPQREIMPPEIALAYASVFKEPRAPLPPVYEPRWTTWGTGFGGSNRTTGDIAVTGSHDLSASTAGFAGGFDYHLSRDSVVGLALAGGGTNWSVSQGLGGGKSDAFQAGLYGATKYGPAYLAAAFAFANHWMSTDRIAFANDHLTADFNAQSYGGRLEGGYRFATVYGGITPYAAIQAQSFHTPGYSESGLIPSGFALAFGSRDATDTRSELGARFDRVLAVYSNAVLALRGRAAWAHDWVSDPTLTPLFQALPGVSFIVNGATPAQNSALASAGGELRFGNGITLLAKFDGEFASHSSTYAGTGTLRYRW
ncbi:MAG: autotransporter domain-containing protein [Xanthobacteraceae bacterium]